MHVEHVEPEYVHMFRRERHLTEQYDDHDQTFGYRRRQAHIINGDPGQFSIVHDLQNTYDGKDHRDHRRKDRSIHRHPPERQHTFPVKFPDIYHRENSQDDDHYGDQQIHKLLDPVSAFEKLFYAFDFFDFIHFHDHPPPFRAVSAHTEAGSGRQPVLPG